MDIKKIIVGKLETNCYLLTSGEEAALVDPGAESDKILTEIKNSNKKLKYIIYTHFHFDHTKAGEEIKEKTGAQILIHEGEKEFIDFKPGRFLKDNEEIKVGNESMKIFHVPGHTEGSICLLGENFILTGDTLFQNGYGRSDLPGGSEEELDKSLEKLGEIIKKGTMVYPGHGPTFKF